MFEGRWLWIVCIFIEFQIVNLSLLCKQYYASVILPWSNQTKRFFPPTSRGLPQFILEHFSPCTRQQFLLEEENVLVCTLFPLCVALDLLWCLQRERGLCAEGQSSRCRNTADEKASCQPPAEGETTGRQPECFWKKDESGSLSISTACCLCSEPQGPRSRWGGSRRLREGEKRERAGTDQATTSTRVSPCLHCRGDDALWCTKWCRLHLWLLTFLLSMAMKHLLHI